MFRWNGTVWVQEPKLLADDGAAWHYFGNSVSVSGDVALVGAWGDDDNGWESGSAYLFRWNGAAWVQDPNLLPEDGAPDDHFGISVSVSGDVALVGALGDDDNGTNSGSASVFSIGLTDCNQNHVFDACDIGTGTSGDCNNNSIPDDCEVPQTGAVVSIWVGEFGFWDDPPDFMDWCLPESPDNNQNATFDVLIDAPTALVVLNTSPTVSTLSLSDDAVLLVNDESGANVRTLAVDGSITNSGIFRATDRERLVLDAPVINQMGECEAGGVLEATDGIAAPGEENDKSILEINGARVLGGVARTIGDNSEIHLIGGAELVDVCVEGVVVPDGQIGRFSGEITNNDVFAVAGQTITTRLEPAALEATLGGPGLVRLTSQVFSQLGHFKGAFTNASTHRIEGAGIIFGGLTNNGTIEANDADGDLIIFPPGDKTNNGTLRATGSGVLRIEDTIEQTETGVVVATGSGTVAVNADVTGAGAFRVSCPTATTATTRGGCTPPPKLAVADRVSITGVTLDIFDEGVVEVAGTATLDLAGAVTIGDGGIYRGIYINDTPPSASLVAASVSFAGSTNPDPEKTAQMLLTGTMALAVTGDVNVCRMGSVSARGGCTPPPKLHVLDAATVDISGSLFLGLEVDVRVGQDANFTLGGDFNNQCRTPTTFEWLFGPLTMKGVESVEGPTTQYFEAGSEDRGADPSGFDDNFAMGVLELAANTTVDIVDVFDNQLDGETGCDEVLYVDTLILNPGAVLNTNGCRVYYNCLIDDGGTIPDLGTDVLKIPVDLDDFAVFLDCMEGPGAEPNPTPPTMPQSCLDRFDAEHDRDVDMADFGGFQRAFTGINP